MPSTLRIAIVRLILLVLLLASWGSAQVNVLGLVVNSETDLPVPRARFFGPDSGFLGSADANGRFELRLPGAVTVTVRQEGYRPAVVALSEVPDLLDVVVALEPTGTRLEERVVTGRTGRRVRVPGSLPRIEEITGMRFDLQEHLRVLPGVSGTREFSSEVSVYGSRSADVSHTLGQFSVPNLRHLDFAFPGNQSVLNPRAVSGIFVEHDPSKGPLEQGLASALRYSLRQAPTDRYDATVALGLTNREFFVTGPIGPGGLTLSGRWLDPSLLRHLGDRFYAGSTRAPEELEDDSAGSGASSDFDLQAFDGLARYDWAAGRLRGAVTLIGGYDKYRLSVYRQDTVLTDISRGRAGNYVAFGEVEGDASWGYWQVYGGRVYRGDLEAIRDTVETDERGFDDPVRAYDRGAYRSDRTDDRIGFVLRPEAPVLGAEAEVLAAGHYIVDEREQGRSMSADDIGDVLGPLGLAARDELAYFRSRLGGRLRWPMAGGTLGLSAGALVVQDETPAPEASVSWIGPYGPYGLNGNLSLRQQEYAHAESFGKLANRIAHSYEAKAGVGRSFLGELDVSAAAYGRLIDDPVLPQPAVWWALPESREAGDAYALGATAQIDWRGWHHFQIQTNVSHVRGEYRMTEGEWLDWEASRDLDLQTFFKIHPRTDTLLAIILSHSATLGQPYYRHERDPADSTRSVHPASWTEARPEFSDFFRTDLRVQLDLPSAIRPFTGFRFYFEGQNLFSEFDGDWARWLGAENYKQRSWEFASDRSSLDPYLTRGLGLFFSFGIEGTLSL